MLLLCLSRGPQEEIVKKVFPLNLRGTQTSSDDHNQAGANDFQRSMWIFHVC